MSMTISYISFIITGASYFIGFITTTVLVIVELHKRKSVSVLSWNGKCVSKLPKSSKSSTNEQSDLDQTIAGSLHYLSIIIYICSILTCVGGLSRLIPNECTTWYQLATYYFALVGGKCAIWVFQLQRYYLCFIQDYKHNVQSPIISDSKLLVLSFYFIAAMGSIIFLIVCIVIVTLALFDANNFVHLYDGIWCGARNSNAGGVRNIVGSITYIVYDWLIIILYFGTIRSLWNKIKHFGNKGNDDTKEAKMNPTIIAADKLKWILTRILFCSVVMQIPFIIGALLNTVTVVGTIMWSLSHLVIAINVVINVIMINLMLQHNSAQYRTFIKRVCICFCINTSQYTPFIKHKIKNNKAENTAVEIVGLHADKDMTKVTRTDVNSSRISIDKAAFVSQKSKEDEVITDVL